MSEISAATLSANPAIVAPEAESFAEEKRTSNTVAGYEYAYWKQVGMTLLFTLTFPILWPIYPVIIAFRTGNRNIFREYWKSISHFTTYFVTFFQVGSVSRGYRYNLLFSPRQLEERLKSRKGACTRCGKCCNQLGCIFLVRDEEAEAYICSAYETPFWYYGTCGRYPLSQPDVDDHGCPGFSFLDADGNLTY